MLCIYTSKFIVQNQLIIYQRIKLEQESLFRKKHNFNFILIKVDTSNFFITSASILICQIKNMQKRLKNKHKSVEYRKSILHQKH